MGRLQQQEKKTRRSGELLTCVSTLIVGRRLFKSIEELLIELLEKKTIEAETKESARH